MTVCGRKQAPTFADQVALEESSEDEFVSVYPPGKMGNTADIAYGGCSLAIGVSAAYKTVLPQYHLYTCMGSYLGPALVDRKYICKVTEIRNTRTFATRQVEVSQEQNDGSRRPCIFLLADFQVAEAASMLEYTTAPGPYPPPAECQDDKTKYTELVRAGKATQQMADFHANSFQLMARYWELSIPPSSMMHQNLYGIAKNATTTQDSLPFIDRTTAFWIRSREKPKSEGESVAGLAFHIDGALSFLPLAHSHLSLQDAGPCSSLDFSIRVFSTKLDISQWHMKELKTVHGSEGRTYSEGRVWDEEGKLVAIMTQMNILRPKPQPKKPSL